MERVIHIWKKNMKMSVITVCFNSANTIRQTIDAVNCQSYKDIEHIFVDGASQDETVSLVKKHSVRQSCIISEPDGGIYDAMNKGIQIASGDVVGILNSDDFYSGPNVIADVISEFKSKNVDCVFADLIYVDSVNTSKVKREWKSSFFVRGAFLEGWHPPHPTFFVKREVYEKYGLFDLDFKISADFELMLRFLEKYQITSSYLPKVIVNMRAGGESGRNFKNILIGNINVLKAFKKNRIKVNPLIYLFKRIAPKLVNRIRHS
jgi:glycosyltransferase involved in cell wall biosynthesis